jgi:hypothetical protein
MRLLHGEKNDCFYMIIIIKKCKIQPVFYCHIINFNSPFCVPAKVIKLVGLKNSGRLSPTNLITFAGTQNGELIFEIEQSLFHIFQ